MNISFFCIIFLRTNDSLGWLFIGALAFIIYIIRAIIQKPQNDKLRTELKINQETISKQLSERPNDIDLILKMAGNYANLGEKEKSLKMIDDAIIINPNSGVLYYYRGFIQCSFEKNLPTTALIFFSKAIELGGLDNNELAYAYCMKGKIGHSHWYKGAVDDLRKAKEMGSKTATQYMKEYRLK